MGCDIHLHGEVKIDGEWEHYAIFDVNRNYRLFAKMAGVRNHDRITPISKPRGMPDDASALTRLDCEHWGPDGHSHSFLDANEVSELETWAIESLMDTGEQWKFHNRYWGYLFGNAWGGWAENRDEYPDRIEDIRFVFWFDN